jgi:beta-glucanase (GH16 family)
MKKAMELSAQCFGPPNKPCTARRITMRELLRRGISVLLLLFLVWTYDASAQNWDLVWSDEFEGDSLDASKWSYQYGTGAAEGLVGWGNNELQYYTDRPDNIFVSDGKLHIIAQQESYRNRNYTSARIRTILKGDWTYGRFEIRARLPEGQGLWPAIWMMPTDNVYGGWAASGEIDIMELLGHEPDVVHGTLHYGGTWPSNVHSGAAFHLPEGKFSDGFHTFTLEWRENQMRWFVDGTLYQIQRSWYSEGHDFPAPFNQMFHMILNVAVGGNWPGSPDQSTVFPQEMIVDYVRVFQQAPTTSTEPVGAGRSPSITLSQNYPNPFSEDTKIEFYLPRASHVSIDLYDTFGRRVKTLTNGAYEPGSHAIRFDSDELANGVYLYRLSAGSHLESRTMILTR